MDIVEKMSSSIGELACCNNQTKQRQPPTCLSVLVQMCRGSSLLCCILVDMRPNRFHTVSVFAFLMHKMKIYCW